MNSSSSYLSPKLYVQSRGEIGGKGVFAHAPAKAGELLAIWGGRVIGAQEFRKLPDRIQQLSVQVEEAHYLAILTAHGEPADMINHSCDPNAGLNGQIAVVAMHDIRSGKEVCIDYAMCDGSAYDEFDCRCGSAQCRGKITGDDWRRPELWERYAGCFSPYLQRRIDRLGQATKHALLSAESLAG